MRRLFCLSLLLLTSCVFPEKFTANLTLSQNAYQYTYKGTARFLLEDPSFLAMMRKKGRSDNFSELKEAVDEARHWDGMEKLTNLGNGIYRVDYERSDNITSFNFRLPEQLEDDAAFIHIDSIHIDPQMDGNTILIRLSQFKMDFRELPGFKYNPRGTFSLTTDGAVRTLKGPAPTVKNKTYTWKINKVDDLLTLTIHVTFSEKIPDEPLREE